MSESLKIRGTEEGREKDFTSKGNTKTERGRVRIRGIIITSNIVTTITTTNTTSMGVMTNTSTNSNTSVRQSRTLTGRMGITTRVWWTMMKTVRSAAVTTSTTNQVVAPISIITQQSSNHLKTNQDLLLNNTSMKSTKKTHISNPRIHNTFLRTITTTKSI